MADEATSQTPTEKSPSPPVPSPPKPKPGDHVITVPTGIIIGKGQ